MRILGIETSCDETSAAVIDAHKNDSSVTLLGNVVCSSIKLHQQTGGIIPEVAAREQLKYIIPVIQQALIESNLYPLSSKIDPPSSHIYRPAIDAIAVTVGPGLIGSLLVGVETAKTLGYLWNIPLIPVNHLMGHIYANFIRQLADRSIEFPAIALIVSGGHTDLVLLKNHKKIIWLGGTRDDAAGEALDKIGRLLGLAYPAGPEIEQLSKQGDVKHFTFPSPMINSDDFDFSFSGLKTAALRVIKTIKRLDRKTVADLSASVQQAVVDVLAAKTIKAAKTFKAKSILLGGGVAANQKLRDELKLKARRYKLDAEIFVPQKFLCTDNGAMIASNAFFNYKPVLWNHVYANPQLYFATIES